MHRAAINAGMVDICFAPELVTSEDSADGLSKKLTAEPSLVRMIIAGSGHTKTLSADSIAWNEARILNGKGYELWRQRKMWPAGLTRDIAIKYGFDVPVSDLTMEDNAEGDTFVIADVDGLGRCATLICQDIHAPPLAADFIHDFQPDWVFIPVLDRGVDVGRWAHQRIFELSGLSNARFMVCNSIALADSKVDAVLFGIAVGPKSANTSDGDSGRTFRDVRIAPGSTPNFVKITWRGDGWSQTVLSAIPKM